MIGPQIVETTSKVSSGRVLDLDRLLMVLELRGPSGVRYESLSSRSGSTITRSAQSPSLLVKPQATWPLLPTTIAGVPGSVTPVICCWLPGSSFVAPDERRPIPDVRHANPQVHVVGHDGAAVGRVAAGHGPVVAAGLEVIDRRGALPGGRLACHCV